MTAVAYAPAKVNLTLDVGPVEDDGYHGLRSVFLRTGLADRLTCSLAGASSADSLVVDGAPDCPVDGNLVLRALDRLRARIGERLPALAVRLEKRVPMAAGLGGGSSDAATTLGLAEAVWGVRLSPAERLSLALELGSDVPFFAADVPAALVEGRGERINPLPGIRGEPALLLAVPPVELSTAAVFARHDDLRSAGGANPGARLTDELASALRSGLDAAALAGWAERLRDANDLWPAASSLARSLVTLRDDLERASGRPWPMSGSGSCLFAVFSAVAEATAAARELGAARRPALAGLRLLVDNLTSPDPAWRSP